MSVAETAMAGRWRQKRRTRKDLLDAAAELMRSGSAPTLEQVADAAMVSRATAYRYFPNLAALLNEAALEVSFPELADVLPDDAPRDPVERLDRVEAAVHGTIARNEVALRLMLAHALEQRATGGSSDAPVRQDRRSPLIAAALGPGKDQFRPGDAEMLKAALAVLIGTEAMVVFRDVLQMDDTRAQKTRRWAIRALCDAARKDAKAAG